jgi:hypothetical protein
MGANRVLLSRRDDSRKPVEHGRDQLRDPATGVGGHRALDAEADDREPEAHGRFDKRDFIWIAKNGDNQCPAGHRSIALTARRTGLPQ